MGQALLAWWREVERLFLLYLLASLAALPVGVAYAILVLNGLAHWLAVSLLLFAGVVTAALVWSALESRIVVQRSEVHVEVEEGAGEIVVTVARSLDASSTETTATRVHSQWPVPDPAELISFRVGLARIRSVADKQRFRLPQPA